MMSAIDKIDCQADIEWALQAQQSFDELIEYLETHEYCDTAARSREIMSAIKGLRYASARYQVMHVRDG
jgi:hypothetical protein